MTEALETDQSLEEYKAQIGECLVKPEVIDLDEIAASVRENYRRAKDSHLETLDAFFAIGNDLSEARKHLRSDNAFGDWFGAQGFPFSRQWAWVLREAARNEVAVRKAVATQVATEGQPNIKKALEAVRGSRPSPPRSPKPPVTKAPAVLKKLVNWERKIIDVSPSFVSELDDARRAEAVSFAESLRGWLAEFDAALEAK